MNKVFVIAEAGINHNGNILAAKNLIDAAIYAGADAVKFQTFWNIKRLKDYELSEIEFAYLRNYSEEKGIEFMSTPHTFKAIHILDRMVKRYKIASTYLTNPNFLMDVASKNKPILLSTGSLVHDDGMATLEEIKNALSFIPDADVTLLHCVSKYPCTDSHLEKIELLKEFGKPIGLSDHTKNLIVPILPVIEKHFMLSGVKCIDDAVSLNPDELSQFIKNIREKE